MSLCPSSLFRSVFLYYVGLSFFIMSVCCSSLCFLSFFIMLLCPSSLCRSVLHHVGLLFFIMWLCHSSICGFVVLHFVALSFFIMWLCHSSLCGTVILHHVGLLFFIMWLCNSSSCGFVVLHFVALSFFIMWLCHSSLCCFVILHYVALSFFIMWICCSSFVEQTLSGFYYCLQQHSVLGDIFVSIVSKQQRYVYCVVTTYACLSPTFIVKQHGSNLSNLHFPMYRSRQSITSSLSVASRSVVNRNKQRLVKVGTFNVRTVRTDFRAFELPKLAADLKIDVLVIQEHRRSKSDVDFQRSLPKGWQILLGAPSAPGVGGIGFLLSFFFCRVRLGFSTTSSSLTELR